MKKLYSMDMVSHFESRPGAMYLTALDQGKDGKLPPTKTSVLDFSEINGGWVHCAGSVTPWGTHLGSEEYEPDAQKRAADGSIDDYYNAMAAYYGNDLLKLNPYHYGYNIEVAVKNFAQVEVTKHFAMGRVAIELSYVMPNQKTVYISDDGTNVGLFRFEADLAGDLSAGTLYAATYEETDTTGMGAANLSWVNLGHATNAEVKKYLGFNADGSIKTTFNDIFEVGNTDKAGSCEDADFTVINTTMGYECLKLKSGMELAASRLETRRYASMLGATTEWRKMEGITFNPETNQLYLAMSEISKAMLPNTSGDLGGHNHINLESENKCGGVYKLELDREYAATSIAGLVAGIPMVTSYGATEDSAEYDGKNKCHLYGLTNPDNISYIPGYNTLIIGKDTGSGHQNDAVWSYNLSTEILTRIQTTPYGSETTFPYVYPDINGFGYIMSVVQHPYGESDQDVEHDASENRGYTGYIGPFPALAK